MATAIPTTLIETGRRSPTELPVTFASSGSEVGKSASLLPTEAALSAERIYRPTARQMRAAYRRNGDPVPANLRGLLGRTFA